MLEIFGTVTGYPLPIDLLVLEKHKYEAMF